MKLTHALDLGLAEFVVHFDLKGRIFFSQAAQSNTHLILVSLTVRFNRKFDDRFREADAFQDDGLVGIAQRITGEGILQTEDRGDVASLYFFNIFTAVSEQPDDTPDT